MGPETNQVEAVEPKPFDCVIVEWTDAYCDGVAQYTSPEAAVNAYSPAVRRTVGMWAGQTDEVVVVCTDDDRCTAEPGAMGGGQFIPQGMVLSITIISEANDRPLST